MHNSTIDRQLAEHGFCVIPGVLRGAELARAQSALESAIELTAKGEAGTFNPMLDPNASSIRVNNLPDFGPVFVDLLRHPQALPIVRRLLGPDAYVSNFTANVALPGAGSMRIHSDQALVMPGPWAECFAMNIIWCLDDIHPENGATRYIPCSHRYRTLADIPADALDKLEAFTAPAGSIIAMEGRLWHTSGPNSTLNERRALLFAYYTRGFLRAQVNWDVLLSERTVARLNEDDRQLLGMGAISNYQFALPLIAMQPVTNPNTPARKPARGGAST
jgi:ectoine hydroxylase-related dioxygenase (phytanoyl-CoA dioxygenase family)